MRYQRSHAQKSPYRVSLSYAGAQSSPGGRIEAVGTKQIIQWTSPISPPSFLPYGLNTGSLFSLKASMPSLASSVPQKNVSISTPISALEESRS